MICARLIVISLCLISFSKSNSQDLFQKWGDLKVAAHQIGFCVYNTEMPFCNEHHAEKLKRQQEAGEEEVDYFVMTEEWASQRISKWSERQKRDRESGVILFDIRQGKHPAGVTSNRKPYNSFVLFSLSDSIHFRNPRIISAHGAMVTVTCKEQGVILENVLWREFMTGRLGRLVKSTSFNILTKSDVKLEYQKFQDAFKAFADNFN